MKSIKIWSLLAMMLIGFAGCDDIDVNGDSSSSEVTGQWGLVSWCNEVPPFNVYVEFKADGTFDMYEQVYSLTYEYVNGTYSLSNGKLTGVYSDGSQWKTSYNVSIENGDGGVKNLKLVDTADASIVSIYGSTTIPEEVKSEATATRAAGAEHFL